MLDVGWSELILIGVVALIVVGPRDLPEMFRTLGRFTAKTRAMARDFSKVMEEAARETGVNDIARDLRETTSAKALGLDAVKNAASKFEQWDPLKAAKAATAPGPATPTSSSALTSSAGAAVTTGAAQGAEVAKGAEAGKVIAENSVSLTQPSAPVAAADPVAPGDFSAAASGAAPQITPAITPATTPAAAASGPQPAARPRGRVRKKPESQI